MENTYSIDTKNFSMDKLRHILKTKEILPGRIILKENIDEHFDLLERTGIDSLEKLIEQLKTKAKIETLANKTCLTIEYLTILRREANSYISAPVKLTDLPFINTELIEKLNSIGIKDSKQLYLKASNLNLRQKLANQIEISLDQLTELISLCDLVRITGVGPVFARIIYDSGIHSVERFLSTDKYDLLERLTLTNEQKGLTRVKFSLKDIEYCIELGKELPLRIE